MSCKASANVTIADISDGTDGTGIASTKVEYQAGSSGTSAPTGTWSTSIPATSASAPYLWTRVTYTYTDGSSPKIVYSVGSTPKGIEVGGRNYILYGKGDVKKGFFTNFNKVENGYGEVRISSKKSYTGININPGFLLGCRDYEVGKRVTFSFDVMFTEWDFPEGSDTREWWIGQRYTSAPSGETGTGLWRGVTILALPKVGVNGCELNKWVHVSNVLTIPEQASSNVSTEAAIRLYNSNADVTATVTMRIKNVKIEYGNKATDWTPAPEDVDSKIEEAQTTANNAQLNIDSANARIDTLVTRTDSLGQSLTSVTQTADKINWLVKSGTSSSNFTLTDRTATLVADYINLNGSVTFNGLNSDTRTKITNGNNAYVWTNANGSNMTNLLSMVKKWTGNAVSDTTTINGGWIGTNTITAAKIAIGDFTNYALVNKNNADKYGFTVVADSSDSNNPWLQLKTLNRDTDLTGGGYTKYKCNGGETFRIKFEVSSTVQGTLTGDSSGTRGYLIIGVGLYGKRTDGSNFWLTPQSYRSDASGTIGAVNTTLTLPSNAREFGVYLQLNGYNFTGTCKVRNISVMKMSSGELIVDGSITADKINVTDLTSLGATIGGWNINSGGISKVTGTKGVYVLNGTDSSNNYLVVNELNSDGSWKSTPFYVRSTGQMYAANATIKGNITATSGKIGSFNINSSLYTNSNALIYTGSSGNVYLGSDGIGFGRSYLSSGGGAAFIGYDGTNSSVEGNRIQLWAKTDTSDNPAIELFGGGGNNGSSSAIFRGPIELYSNINFNSHGLGFVSKTSWGVCGIKTLSNGNTLNLFAQKTGNSGWTDAISLIGSDGTIQIPTKTGGGASGTWEINITGYIKDYSGHTRMPASSAKSDGARVSYIASKLRSSDTKYYVTIQGQYGTTGSTYKEYNYLSTSSDVRLKENIADSNVCALDTINEIKIRQFDYRQTGNHQKIGVVADELELIDTAFTFGGGYTEDGSMNIKSVDTFYMMGYVVKGIQEICSADNERDEKIQSNEARVDSLQTQLNEAMNQIAELKKLVELLTA